MLLCRHNLATEQQYRIQNHLVSLLITMPRGSGNSNSGSGYNSHGNHYNTPGGTNSSSGSSYHCKPPFERYLLCVLDNQILRLTHSHILSQTQTLMDRTTTPMTMDPLTTTRATVRPRTLRRRAALITRRRASNNNSLYSIKNDPRKAFALLF
jgi:hypothetical protein